MCFVDKKDAACPAKKPRRKAGLRAKQGCFELCFVDKKDAGQKPLRRNGFKHIRPQSAVNRDFSGKSASRWESNSRLAALFSQVSFSS
jgi:hypothetical protein